MKKILPKLQRYLICPDFEEKILEFYKDYYECVFVALHPFMKVKAFSIPYNRFNSDEWPNKKEIINGTEKITWGEILNSLDLSNFSDIDLALRGIIGGLKDEFRDLEIENKIIKYCKEEKIIKPQEGYISELIFDNILDSIKSLGSNWIWVCDEFGLERKLEHISELICDENHDIGGNYFTYNNEIRVTTHWDSHFTLICSNFNFVEKIKNKSKLEGFYCDINTKIKWSFENKFKNK